MDDALATLFSDFDRGTLTRRQLFQALGIAAVVSPLSAAFGQGSCGGTSAGTARCDTMPFKPPFEPTGWKTVLMDHFSIQCADFVKEAAYFNALMGWKVRSVDSTKAVLDIGDWGGAVFRGGLAAPAPAAPPPAAPAGGDSAVARGGRGGGRGGGGGPRSVWDGFCWGIQPWDTAKVEAELKKRGLNPVADHDGKDFQSFHVKDPDGFDVQISNGSKKNRRTSAANAKLPIPAPFDATGWRTMRLDHISFSVTSYKETAAFYRALLGWKSLGDEGSLSEHEVNPEIGDIIIRGGNANAPGGLTAGGRGGRGGRGAAAGDTAGRGGPPPAPAPLVRRARIDHCAFGIADFDPDKVKAELDKRGLNARTDTGATASSPPADRDIHTARYKSYHTTTPNGFDLQISNNVSGSALK